MYIVVDLDDTLLNTDKKVSDYTLLKLNEFRKNGHKLVFNTARSLNNSLEIINLVKPDYSILNGGSLIVDDKEKVIFSYPFNNQMVKELLDELMIISSKISVQTLYTLYTSDPSYKNQNAVYRDYKNNPLDEEVFKIVFSCDSNEMAMKIAEKYQLECLNYLGGKWYRLTPRGITKFSGLVNFLKVVNSSLKDVIAFGDDYGDLEMLLKAGCGVAMANSVEEVLKQVPNHALDCNNDGVVKYLENYFNNK